MYNCTFHRQTHKNDKVAKRALTTAFTSDPHTAPHHSLSQDQGQLSGDDWTL